MLYDTQEHQFCNFETARDRLYETAGPNDK